MAEQDNVRFVELRQTYEAPAMTAFFIRAQVDAEDAQAAARRNAREGEINRRVVRTLKTLSLVITLIATVAAAMSDAGAWKWLAVVPPLLFCISAFSNQVFVETQAI